MGPWRTSSQMPYRSSSAASGVNLAQFDLRVIRAMQSSGRPRHDGRVHGQALAALAGARTGEAIVPAVEPDDRYPGRRPAQTTGVAASTSPEALAGLAPSAGREESSDPVGYSAVVGSNRRATAATIRVINSSTLSRSHERSRFGASTRHLQVEVDCNTT
jgi:hypothetical protein